MFIQCTYCGVQANALDHIIPVSYDYVSRKAAKFNKELTIPVCNECNLILSDIWLPTISQRAGYLLEKYNIKYKKILKQPKWEEWEIEELGENMKKIVISNMSKKEDILERLKFLLCVYSEENLNPQDIWNKYPEDAFSRFKVG